MDLPLKLGVCVNAVSHRHWLGENSGAHPKGPSKATAASSTNVGAMSARQGPGKCGRKSRRQLLAVRETLAQLERFVALASQQRRQQSALRNSRR